eukprot:478872_1
MDIFYGSKGKNDIGEIFTRKISSIWNIYIVYGHFQILFMDIFNKFLNFMAHKYLYLQGQSSNRSRGALQYQILPSHAVFNVKKMQVKLTLEIMDKLNVNGVYKGHVETNSSILWLINIYICKDNHQIVQEVLYNIKYYHLMQFLM